MWGFLKNSHFWTFFRSVMSPNYSKLNMKACLSLLEHPVLWHFLVGACQKVLPNLFRLFCFFFAFPFSLVFVILLPLLTASWLLTASCQSVQEFLRRRHPKGKFLSTDEEGNFSSVFKFINLCWFWSSISLCFGYHCRFGFSSFKRFFIIVRGAFFM